MRTRTLTIIAAVSPLVFTLLTVFFTYERIEAFLLGGLSLVIVEFILIAKIHSRTSSGEKDKNWLKTALPFLLITVGAIGLSTATTLTREKIALIADPNYAPTCSISPIVACSPIIGSEQASALGIPNPLLGIFGYGALLIAGFSLLAGGTFVHWWWKSLWLGTALGLGFCAWLIYVSLYEIGALCIFCMVAWAITAFIFNYVTLYCIQNGYIRSSKRIKDLYTKNHAVVLTALYAFVTVLIYFRFDYYWRSLI